MRPYILLLITLCGLICSACATVTPAPTDAADVKCTNVKITFAKQDDGKSVVVKKGERFAVALGSNRTTGFEWEADTFDAKLLNFDGKTYQGTGTGVGSGGTETLCFTAIEIGKAPIMLIYHRTFEKGVPPAETFKLNMEIKP